MVVTATAMLYPTSRGPGVRTIDVQKIVDNVKNLHKRLTAVGLAVLRHRRPSVFSVLGADQLVKCHNSKTGSYLIPTSRL